MVISVEPALYLPEVGGFRHSDTVLVTDSGYELLTKFPTGIDDLLFTAPRAMKRLKGGFFAACCACRPKRRT